MQVDVEVGLPAYSLAKYSLYKYGPATINMRWIFHIEVSMCTFHLIEFDGGKYTLNLCCEFHLVK